MTVYWVQKSAQGWVAAKVEPGWYTHLGVRDTEESAWELVDEHEKMELVKL